MDNSTLITKIRTSTGDHQIDYNALANLPDIYSKSETDSLLSEKASTSEIGEIVSQNSYTKAEILSDTTKTAFELENTAVPDDVFSKLYHGMSSSVIFEVVLEASETNYIIDLRDVDYSKYPLFAFVLENETEDGITLNPVYNFNGNPSGSSGTYNNYWAIRNSDNTNQWLTNNYLMFLSGKNDMLLFKFSPSKMSLLKLRDDGLSIGFCEAPSASQGIYGFSFNKRNFQAKIKILGLNLR